MDYQVFDQILDGILVIDSDKRIIYCNSAATTLGGLEADKVRKGALFSEVIKFKETDQSEMLFSSGSDEIPTPYREMTIVTCDGNVAKVQVSVLPQMVNNEELNQRWILYIRDVTLESSLHAKYRAELEKKEKVIRKLEETQDQLIQFSKTAVIGQVFASLSHELSNPLTYLIYTAENLKETLAEDSFQVEEVRKLSSSIYSGAQKMAKLLKELKAFLHSPLSTDQFVYSNVSDIIDKAIGFSKHFTSKNNIQIINRVSKDLPSTLLDPTLIEQIAINLIRNAADALVENSNQPCKSIEIAAEFKERANSITISFTDNGPGISQEIMNKLFTPFFTTKPIGKGTGLGLSLCSSMAEKHGGMLSAKSTVGKGSSFFLTLPVREPQCVVEKGDFSKHLRGCKVLLIDDEPWMRSIQKGFLSPLGCDIYEAENGNEALKQCRELDFDLVITDLNMPEMNGLEFASKARELDHKMRIILISGSLAVEQVGSNKELFDDYVEKPFSNDLIQKVIMKVIEQASSKVNPLRQT